MTTPAAPTTANDSAAPRFEPSRGFGVYVHWPYCARICPYCDFNVYAAKDRDGGPLLEAILADLDGWRARSGDRAVDAVFFGGGTPSLLKGREIGALLERIDSLWGIRPDAEVTLEANPDDLGRFAEFAASGVNRLSVGVQSLDEARLKFLGRTHGAGEAIAALETARRLFRSVSADMIYALPGETLDGWRAELGRAVALDVDHLSLYELSIEPGAAFAYSVRRGEWAPLDDDRAADLYELTQDLTLAAGFPAYEVSNHARGPEHESAHNRIYWRSGDWAGVGPGAHGRLTADGDRLATEAANRPGEYMKLVRGTGVGFADPEPLSDVDRAREAVAMGLRVVEGMALAELEALGARLSGDAFEALIETDRVRIDGERLTLTIEGRLAADRVASIIAP
jgi:putative oxygen-independent coproporphyrinogen III oxidase